MLACFTNNKVASMTAEKEVRRRVIVDKVKEKAKGQVMEDHVSNGEQI